MDTFPDQREVCRCHYLLQLFYCVDAFSTALTRFFLPAVKFRSWLTLGAHNNLELTWFHTCIQQLNFADDDDDEVYSWANCKHSGACNCTLLAEKSLEQLEKELQTVPNKLNLPN